MKGKKIDMLPTRPTGNLGLDRKSTANPEATDHNCTEFRMSRDKCTKGDNKPLRMQVKLCTGLGVLQQVHRCRIDNTVTAH